MPRAFDEREREQISVQLKQVALKMFSASGVAKISVDQLTRSVGIAKGSFYRFYESKEMLYFELLEEAQNRLRAPLLQRPRQSGQPMRASLERKLRTLFRKISEEPLIQFMGREQELNAILRRVSAQRLQQHQRVDQDFLERFIACWNSKPEAPPRDQVAACVTLILLIGLKSHFIGERLLPYALDAAIGSLCDCFFDSASQ